jgi:hypothetical protein
MGTLIKGILPREVKFANSPDIIKRAKRLI